MDHKTKQKNMDVGSDFGMGRWEDKSKKKIKIVEKKVNCTKFMNYIKKQIKLIKMNMNQVENIILKTSYQVCKLEPNIVNFNTGGNQFVITG